MDFPSNDSYFSLLNLSFVENCHISIFTTFAKQSMINRLSNPINRNRAAAKILKVMSSSLHAIFLCALVVVDFEMKKVLLLLHNYPEV